MRRGVAGTSRLRRREWVCSTVFAGVQGFPWAILITLILASLGQGAPGDLDPSFGTGGIVTTDFWEFDWPTALLLQPDGKLVAGPTGRSYPAEMSFGLVRYLPDGSLDTTFGLEGKVAGPHGEARALVLQLDGKLVQAGSGLDADDEVGGNFMLVRYLPDGSLDASFGNGGKVLTVFGGEDQGIALALLLQPDGKLVAAGTIYEAGGGSTFGLVRYHSDGSLDVSFGTAGKVTTAFGGFDWAAALVLQPDGKLVAAGTARPSVGSMSSFALVRHHPDGSLDPSFGTDGKVTTTFSWEQDNWLSALVLQPDGKLVAAGSARNESGEFGFALARYLPDGSLDASFGSGGKVLTTFGYSGVVKALVLQPDGKLVAVGNSWASAVDDINVGLARYLPDGSLDASFGSGGKVLTALSAFGDDYFPYALVLQPDGKLVVAGIITTSHSPSNRDLFLARYHGEEVAGSCLGTGPSRIKGRMKAGRRVVAGVTIAVNGPGDCSDTRTTDNRGRYQFGELGDGLYTVTPVTQGCTSSPTARQITIAGRDAKADFTATCP